MTAIGNNWKIYKKILKLRETFGGTNYKSATVQKKSAQQ